MQTLSNKIIRVIRFCFYALFIITPFAMTNTTHELFEFNKMWLVYGISILIFFFWGVRMVTEKRFFVRRTVLDIPILLFFFSQILATIFSIDSHTSFWGYYSRFNGGLLSTITYIFLYYALVSNFLYKEQLPVRFAKRLLIASSGSALLVTLWGLPSHFGFDPTCYVFVQDLSTKCWTAAFDPTARIFSTLGQPNWLAAYLSILLVIAVSMFIKVSLANKTLVGKFTNYKLWLLGIGLLLTYTAIIWTGSQSGFLGFWAGLFVFAALLKLVAIQKTGFSISNLWKLKSLKILGLLWIVFLLITFLIGNPFPPLQKYSLGNLTKDTQEPLRTTPAGPSLENNITGSGDIRLIVWSGALDIFKANPLFGTGVETFAYAYYKHRPLEHNLTSEWDYLYNKAHNEYLNYLATTGLFGLGTYLVFIGSFLFISLKFFLKEKSVTNSIIPAGIVGGFVTILISNFFGFSVVLTNTYLFLLPAFFLMITGKKGKIFAYPKKTQETYRMNEFTTLQFLVFGIISILSLILMWKLISFWNADKAYALGYNYNKIDQIVMANEYLEKAVSIRPNEDLYKNELSQNLASLALAYAQENNVQQASQYTQRAKDMSDAVIRNNPNNIVYYKTRVRTLFTLSQLQPTLLSEAYQTIIKSQELAPTDAKIIYNKALIEEVTGKPERALETLEEAIKLKSNYIDAYYRQAIVLSTLAENTQDPKQAEEYRTKARERLNYLLTNLAPDFTQAQELLKTLD